MSPEVALFKPYSHKADVWSVGVVYMDLMILEEIEIISETFQRLEPASIVVPNEFKPLRDYVCNAMVVLGESNRADIDQVIANDLFSNHYQLVDARATAWQREEDLRELNEQLAEVKVAGLNEQLRESNEEKSQLRNVVEGAQQQMQAMMQVSFVEI